MDKNNLLTGIGMLNRKRKLEETLENEQNVEVLSKNVPNVLQICILMQGWRRGDGVGAAPFSYGQFSLDVLSQNVPNNIRILVSVFSAGPGWGRG